MKEDKEGTENRKGIRMQQSFEECYRIVLENSNEIVMEYDVEKGSIYHVTDLVEHLYQVPKYLENAAEYLLGQEIVLPESGDVFLEMLDQLKAGAPQADCVIRTKTINGEKKWNRLVFTTVFGDDKKPVKAVGILKDITEQKKAELQYESALMYRNALEGNALLFYEADLTNLEVISGLETVLGLKPGSKKIGYMDALHLVTEKIVYHEDRSVIYTVLDPEHLMELYRSGITKTEMEYRRNIPGGEVGWVRGTVYLTEDKPRGSIRAFYYIHDIDADKREMLKLREKAEKDLLTGIYNKVTAEQKIRDTLNDRLDPGRVSAFFVIDLDNFKSINDRLGHAYGDAVLSEIARKLKSLCRREDIVGRIGGDEFVIFLKDLPGLKDVEEKANRICNVFHRARSEGESSIRISGTVGGAVFPDHGTDFEQLYRKADLALYEAKKRGKDTSCIYNESMRDINFRGFDREVTETSTGKTFAENIIEYAFRILYNSRDLDLAIHGIVELMAKHFEFCRGYLYQYDEKQDACVLVSEWSIKEVYAIAADTKRINGEQLTAFLSRFGEDGFYFVRSSQELKKSEIQIPDGRELMHRIQYALMSSGKFQGFLGFDCFSGDFSLDQSKVSVLKGVSQMLDVFLAQRHANEKLEEARRMLQTISDNMRTCTYIIDPKTHILQFVNRSTAAIIPMAKPGACCYETIRGEAEPCHDCPIDHMMAEGLPCFHTEMYLPPYRMWANIDTSMVILGDNKEYALFNGYDFKEYKNRSNEYIIDVEAFTKDEEMYRALSASTDDYIYLCDMPKNLFYFPEAMVEDFGLPGQIIEDAVPLWGTYIHPNEQPGYFQDIQNLLDGVSSHHNQEYRARNKDGEWVWLRCRGYVTRDEKGNPLLFAGMITNLQKKGKIDHISGLPNKFEFEGRVRNTLTMDWEGAELLLLGLDNFKHVNSLYGWEFGDWVLRDLAKQMQMLLPHHITVYRMDGDKFGIFLTAQDEIDAVEVYQTLHAAFQIQQEYNGHRYHCTLSGGYSAARNSDFKILLKEAEYALEYSKGEGKNRLCQYDPALMSGRDRMFAIIERLRECVEHNFENFEVYYQPQVDASSQVMRGAEALLRWHCEEYGIVPPLEFIPFLEQTGMINAVGEWVIRQAAAVCEEWKKLLPDFVMSVNVSYLQLREEGFLEKVAAMVRDGSVCSHSMNLELTESCIVAQDAGITQSFTRLREMGFRIALDDFGTGYSSLAILKNAPADVVKLDRYFVKDIIKSNFDAAFIRTVVTLCHSVGIEVCLEGVENWEEYQLVNPMGLDYIQGYLFGRPEPKSDFEKKFLKKNK